MAILRPGIIFSVILSVLLTFYACPRLCIAGETSPLTTLQLPSGKVITAEVASTYDEKIQGLKLRKYLAEDRGMLFVYPEDGFHGIWMKDCLISLDILWLDRDYSIIYMKERAPPCNTEHCQTYKPPIKSRYVLEVHEGLAKKERLGPGSRLVIIGPGMKP